MPSGLLAVTDDVQPCRLLVCHRKANRINFRLFEVLAFVEPLRPKLFGRAQPTWLGEASGNRGGKKLGHPVPTGAGAGLNQRLPPLKISHWPLIVLRSLFRSFPTSDRRQEVSLHPKQHSRGPPR